MEKVFTQKLWTFKLGTQEGVNIPIWINIGFQQKERQSSQSLKSDTIFRPPVTSAQCIIGTEKYTDSAILLRYDCDDCSQECGQYREVFRALTKDDILKSYISDNDFGSSNNGIDIGYNLYNFDRRYQKILESAQPNQTRT